MSLSRGNRLLALLAALGTAAIAWIQSASAGDFTDLAFTPQVLTMKELSFVIWNPAQEKLKNDYFKKYSMRRRPNGDTEFIDTTGRVVRSIQVASVLNAEKTHRYVAFTLRYTGSYGVRIEVITEGTELKDVPIEEVLRGELPFFPSPNETATRVVLTGIDGDTGMASLIFTREDSENYRSLSAEISGNGRSVVRYRDLSTPTRRELSYVLLPANGTGPVFTLGAVRTKRPGMLLGSESFTINNEPAAFQDYQSIFNGTFLSIALDFLKI